MQCRRVVNEARRSQHGFGVLDVGRDLAMLSIWHPDEANWEPLLALLAEINVAPRHKNGALTLLADTAELIPDSVVHELRRIAEEVAAHPHLPQPLEPTDRSALGPALDLIAALPGSAPTFGDLRQQIFTLLAGDDGDRSQAAKLASRGAGAATVGLLVGLLQDSHPSVRSTAAASLVGIGIPALRPSRRTLSGSRLMQSIKQSLIRELRSREASSLRTSDLPVDRLNRSLMH